MVEAGMNDKVSDNPAASTAQRRKLDARSLKLIECSRASRGANDSKPFAYF